MTSDPPRVIVGVDEQGPYGLRRPHCSAGLRMRCAVCGTGILVPSHLAAQPTDGTARSYCVHCAAMAAERALVLARVLGEMQGFTFSQPTRQLPADDLRNICRGTPFSSPVVLGFTGDEP